MAPIVEKTLTDEGGTLPVIYVGHSQNPISISQKYFVNDIFNNRIDIDVTVVVDQQGNDWSTFNDSQVHIRAQSIIIVNQNPRKK